MKNLFILFFLSTALIFTGCQDTEESNQQDASVTENEEVVRTYIEAYNNRDLDALNEVLADPISMNESEQGLDNFLDVVQRYWESFPDIELKPTHLIGAGDYVTVYLQITATGDGEYFGHDIDGKSVETTESMLFQIKDGKIAGYLYNWDELGFWTQLGVLESPYPEE